MSITNSPSLQAGKIRGRQHGETLLLESGHHWSAYFGHQHLETSKICKQKFCLIVIQQCEFYCLDLFKSVNVGSNHDWNSQIWGLSLWWLHDLCRMHLLANKCSCIRGSVSFGHVLIMINPSMWIWVNSGYVCRGTNTTPKNARIYHPSDWKSDGSNPWYSGDITTVGASWMCIPHSNCSFNVIVHFYPSTVMARKWQNSSKTANLASCLTSTDVHPKNDSLKLILFPKGSYFPIKQFPHFA